MVKRDAQEGGEHLQRLIEPLNADPLSGLNKTEAELIHARQRRQRRSAVQLKAEEVDKAKRHALRTIAGAHAAVDFDVKSRTVPTRPATAPAYRARSPAPRRGEGPTESDDDDDQDDSPPDVDVSAPASITVACPRPRPTSAAFLDPPPPPRPASTPTPRRRPASAPPKALRRDHGGGAVSVKLSKTTRSVVSMIEKESHRKMGLLQDDSGAGEHADRGAA
ncbi:hypothetical protein HK101_011434, partial [Irineochytrium annulatum]